jgi:hypothetical protein
MATCFHAGFFLGLFFNTEDGGDMFARNFCWPYRTTRRYIPEARILQNYLQNYYKWLYRKYVKWSNCDCRSNLHTFIQDIILLWFFVWRCECLDYIVRNCKMVDGWWIGKDLEGNSRELIQVLSRNLPTEGLKKTLKTLGRCTGRNANLAPPTEQGLGVGRKTYLPALSRVEHTILIYEL